MKRALAIAGLVVVLLAIAATAAAWWRVGGLERDLRDERVAGANAQAALDSTRLAVQASSAALRQRFGEALAVAERRAFQAEARAELAGREARERAVAIAQLELRADSLERTVSHETLADAAGAIAVADTLDARDSLGILAAATVDLTPRPGPPPLVYDARWRWQLQRSAIPLRLELTCRDHEAIARLGGPAWAPLGLDSIVQDDTICNPIPRASWQPFRLEAPSAVEAGLAIAAWEGLRWILDQLRGGKTP